MLFEKITYQNDFPINVTVANINEDPIHYHQDIEFVYVLKGSVKLKNGYCTYNLKAGDVFTNVGHEVHAIYKTDEENIVAIIQVSTQFFSQFYPNLSRSCYRTYSTKASDEKYDTLKKKLLQILLHNAKKTFNYRNECIYGMIDVIDYLDKYYDYFSFENSIVINNADSNSIVNSRISNIIRYVYQYHANKITLNELAEMEHLSPFYLSHLITSYTGMSFRDFLCFARVEWSEIYLLEGNEKISSIAKKVGFSTTSYYEKYFTKWFGISPAQHRAKYQQQVKSDARTISLEIYKNESAVALIKDTLSKYTSQENSLTQVSALKLDLNINCDSHSDQFINNETQIIVTLSDYMAMGISIIATLKELNVTNITLWQEKKDDLAELQRFKSLLDEHFSSVSIYKEYISNSVYDLTNYYGRDSIAAPIVILEKVIHGSEKTTVVRLRDTEQQCKQIVKGSSGIMTTNLIRKPSFYAMKAIPLLKGNMIQSGNNYGVIQGKLVNQDYYVVVSMNYNDKILRLCSSETTAQEVNDTLLEFNDEIELSFNMNLPAGKYSIMEYTFSKVSNVFNYISEIDFEKYIWFDNTMNILDSKPEFKMYLADVKTSLLLNHTIKGAGIQISIIRKIS